MAVDLLHRRPRHLRHRHRHPLRHARIAHARRVAHIGREDRLLRRLDSELARRESWSYQHPGGLERL